MKKSRILILAHYYYPDIVATANILEDLAESVTEYFDVDVLAVNKGKYKKVETINGVNIHRIKTIIANKKNKLSRILDIFIYFFKAIFYILFNNSYDIVFAISQPPVLGGVLGRIAKTFKKSKFIYCIQDLNPEQIIAVNYLPSKILLKILLSIDKRNCIKADSVITIDKDMKKSINNRFDKDLDNIELIPNWIDDKKIYPLDKNDLYVKEFLNKYNLNNKYIIMYSGNLGLYYDLLNILKVIKEFKEVEDVAFVFVGEGAVKEEMISYKERNSLKNVYFLPYSSREDLNYSLNAADIHFCINAKGIKGISCPSKFYGIAAVNKPVIMVMEKDTTFRNLVEENKLGYVSDPGDYNKLKLNLNRVIREKPTYTDSRKHIINGKNESIDKYIKVFNNVLRNQ